MVSLYNLCIILLFVGSTWASCHSQPFFGSTNNYPINEASEQMNLLNTTSNGKLYWVTVPHDGGNTTSGFTLVHVWGTPYEMGFAQGTLLNESVSGFMNQVWQYMEAQIDQFLGDLPDWLQEYIADMGLDGALDFTYELTVDYTNPAFYEEMRGLADATGVDYNTIVRIHMLPGLTQGACSAFGMWGDALAKGYSLLQLRALDWNMDGPFINYPSMTVYHPNIGEGHAFYTMSFQGFVGGLTGASANLSISEIGVGYPDSTFGSQSRIGLPFIFLLRDILQYDICLDDATNRMVNARRTCNLILGVGDRNYQQFRGYEYSYSIIDVMNPQNMRPYNNTWHPRINDVVYWGMDWDCPAYNYVLSSQIKKFYGEISPELAIQQITAVTQTGDDHISFYDLPNSQVFISFARQNFFDGPIPAYQRQFTRFDLNDLFNESPPSQPQNEILVAF